MVALCRRVLVLTTENSLTCWPSMIVMLVSMFCVCLVSPSPGAPRDWKCITNNLQIWDCSWKAPSGAGGDTLYEVCIENR